MINSIEINDISKKYRISETNQYSTLRDMISEGSLTLFRKNKPKARDIWALKGVSFSAKMGDIVGIVGRNGAGKSTLLKILSRIVSPSSGEARLEGRVASMLEVGTGFHQELTGRENIYLNGAILGMNKQEINRKFNDIIEFSEIGKFIDTPVKRYSSGMKVRLAFSVAAHLDPEILLIDEVLAVGDISFQRKSLQKMHELTKNEGRTVLFVSHNTSAIDILCNKVAILDNGKLAAFGETRKMISQYVTKYIKEESTRRLTTKIGSNKSKIVITDFWLENVYKKRVKSVKTGDVCYLAFKYHKTTKNNLKNVDFGFAIKGITEQPLVLNLTSFSNKQLDNIRADGQFRFKVSKIPLTTGRYIIGYRITVNDVEDDYLQNAAEFDVDPGEFYVPGISVKQTHSPFYLDGEWQNE